MGGAFYLYRYIKECFMERIKHIFQLELFVWQ